MPVCCASSASTSTDVSRSRSYALPFRVRKWRLSGCWRYRINLVLCRYTRRRGTGSWPQRASKSGFTANPSPASLRGSTPGTSIFGVGNVGLSSGSYPADNGSVVLSWPTPIPPPANNASGTWLIRLTNSGSANWPVGTADTNWPYNRAEVQERSYRPTRPAQRGLTPTRWI